MHAKSLSHVQLFATPWTIAHQAPLSMGVLQAKILELLTVPFEPMSLTSSALAGGFFPASTPGKPIWRWRPLKDHQVVKIEPSQMGLVSSQKNPRDHPYPFSHVWIQGEESHAWMRKWALTRYWICWCFDFGIPRLEN